MQLATQSPTHPLTDVPRHPLAHSATHWPTLPPTGPLHHSLIYSGTRGKFMYLLPPSGSVSIADPDVGHSQQRSSKWRSKTKLLRVRGTKRTSRLTTQPRAHFSNFPGLHLRANLKTSFRRVYMKCFSGEPENEAEVRGLSETMSWLYRGPTCHPA